MINFSFENFEFEFTKDEREIKRKYAFENVKPLFDEYILMLKTQHRIKTAHSYQSALNSLLKCQH